MPATRPVERQLFPSDTKTRYRTALLVAVTAYFGLNLLADSLLPHGPAVELPYEMRLEYAAVDPSNDLLQSKYGRTRRIVERLSENQTETFIKAPETVVFGPDGTMYLMTEEAKLLRLDNFQPVGDKLIEADVHVLRSLGVGRPLGGQIVSKTLWIADSLLGLTRLPNLHDPKSKVELVVNTAYYPDGTPTRIRFADDLAIGPKSGKVYLTDASDVAPDRVGTRTWDTWYASKIDGLRGIASGRVIQYDPATDRATVIASGLRFANGIAVDKDETFLFVSETFGLNLYKYHLQGPRQGQLDVVVESKNIPGYLDGVHCSASTGKCYAAVASSVAPVHKVLNVLPPVLDLLLRNFFMMLPRALSPDTPPYCAIVEYDPVTNEMRLWQDPTGADLSYIASVVEHDGRLYMGSVHNRYIGVHEL